jgi:hypothetical protein
MTPSLTRIQISPESVYMTHLADSVFQNTSIQSEDEFTAVRQADRLLTYASDAWAFQTQQSLDHDEDIRQ